MEGREEKRERGMERKEAGMGGERTVAVARQAQSTKMEIRMCGC